MPLLLTVSALAVVLLLAALRPAQRGPGPRVATLALPTPSSTPSVTSTATSTRTLTPTATATSSPTFTPLPPIIHVVESGEYVLLIAEKHGVSESAILEANNLQADSILQIGQRLIVPRPTPTLEPGKPTPTNSAATRTRSSTPGPPSGLPSPTPRLETYDIQRGDTLESIAGKFGVTVDAIIKANQIADAGSLQPGQRLVIPARATPESPVLGARAGPTQTPGQPYPAPPLLAPADGTPYSGAEAMILLHWASVSLLKADEWYELSLQDPGGRITTVRTRATAWRVPGSLRPFPDADAHTFTWRVDVVRGEQEGGPSVRLSSAGEQWMFRWD